jgi:hypothetical protein
MCAVIRLVTHNANIDKKIPAAVDIIAPFINVLFCSAF